MFNYILKKHAHGVLGDTKPSPILVMLNLNCSQSRLACF